MTEEAQTNMGTIVAKGLVGTATPIIGLVVSGLSEIESWMRIGSLAIGMAVGMATLISIIRKRKGND